MAVYPILRFKLLKAGSVSGAYIHNERQKNAYSNPNIDPKRSGLNYHLVKPEESYTKEWKKRVEKAGCKVRSNSNVLIETVISATPDYIRSLVQDEQRRYFERAFSFMESRVTRENIVSAVVHVDETYPHMHLCFCPITKDGRLNTHDFLGERKYGLIKWQTDFHAYMSEQYPVLERGTSSGITHREAIPLALYQQAVSLDHVYPELIETLKGINRFNLYKKWDKAMRICSENQKKYKSFSLQLDEFKGYRDTAERLRSENEILKKKADDMEKENDSLQERLDNTQYECRSWYQEYRNMYYEKEKLQKALYSLPPDIRAHVLPERDRDEYER